jgi:hypothetical protein
MTKKSITFDPEAQQNLPENIKAKMKADRKKAAEKQAEKQRKFEEAVRRVGAINQKLKDKKYTWEEIDKFWARMIRIVPKISKTGIENIKVCTGCGHLNIEDLGPTAMACCPDSKYVPIIKK